MVKVLALLSVTILCLTASYEIVRVSKHFSDTLMQLDSEIDEMHRLTLEAGLTAMEARKASAKESAYLDQWNTQIALTFRNANETIASMRSVSAAAASTLQTTQQTVASLQNPIQSANAALTAAQKATSDLDALIQDPHITATIAHTDATLSHLDATSADVQQEVHSITHPGWAHRVWEWTLDVAHVFNPL